MINEIKFALSFHVLQYVPYHLKQLDVLKIRRLRPYNRIKAYCFVSKTQFLKGNVILLSDNFSYFIN